MRAGWGIAVLLAGFAACSLANDAETPVAANFDPPGQSGGTPEGCPDDFEACGQACVLVDSDPRHCGGCDQPCAEEQVCALGQCLTVCPAGMSDCDGACVDQMTDPAHCGACDGVCPAGDGANTAATCASGLCGVGCAVGFADCNDDAGDGCEQDIAGDPAHCGGCDDACLDPPNAAAMCDAGSCAFDACLEGFADCNAELDDGCEVDTTFDDDHCGACDMGCSGSTPFCVHSDCAAKLYDAGVQSNVPVSHLKGWSQCHLDNYDDSGTTMASILAACSGNFLLLACRPNGEDTLSLAAMGPRADVLFDCGTTQTCVHDANGVGWYYSDVFSWGFAPAGDPVSRNSCDTAGDDPEERLCWHTSGGNIDSGYRCGFEFPFDDYERLIFQAN